MSKYKRIFSIIIAFALIFSMAFSVLFVAQEANHSCCGADCPICSLIVTCLELFGTTASVALTLIIVSASRFSFSAFRSKFEKSSYSSNPIILKVKLSN